MDTFFCQDIVEGLCYLSQDESHHAARVLRKKVGEAVRLIDGNGRVGTGVFEEIHKKNCIIQTEVISDVSPLAYQLNIGIAPTKNLDRLEWFLEKSTELGVHRIVPILCQHSERKVIRKDRLEKVVMAATKQSLGAFLPKLGEMTSFGHFLDGLSAENEDRYIAYCGEGAHVDLSSISKQGGKTLVLIGPEGGFSQEEYRLALQKGFKSLTLGASRLRTETAGVYVAAAFRFINN